MLICMRQRIKRKVEPGKCSATKRKEPLLSMILAGAQTSCFERVPEKAEKTDRAEKPEKSQKAEKSDKPDKPEKPDKKDK